jgi:hypothetical protein
MSKADRQRREQVRQERQRAQKAERREQRQQAVLPLSISRRQLITDFLREFKWTLLKSLPLGVILPMSFFLGSVGPDDFSKNYAAWANRWGLTNWADWLSVYATGPRVFWGIVLISFLYLATAFWLPALIKRASRDFASVAVPFAVAFIVVVTIFGSYALSSSGERHVSEYQRIKIKEVLSPIAASFPRALTVASVDTPEANGYAELMIALNLAGLKIQTGATHGIIAPPGAMKSIGTGIRGVFFQVRNPQVPPSEALSIKKALEEAGIRIAMFPNPDFPEADYILTIANP